MSYFPALLKIENSKVLVVGGGNIAGDKIEKLLDFTKDITVISPDILDKTKELIDKNRLNFINREYRDGDIEGFSIVVVAVDNISLQQTIFKECQKYNILCNSVDSVEYCNFIFPSYIKRGNLIVAFSTSGLSPSVSKYLRVAIEKLIPDSIETFLDEMKKIRDSLPKGKERMKLLDQKAKEYIDKHFNIFKKS
ncbi:MAG TPA: bifunctional precorrin-2 dehydrogenase/sirohydrochlorin ferrochelatase [Sulfurimonas autotrophica]|nr:bifunctional precorrin-2 dehydrogenase/sirohydrochlorin ferrochelatase [Sulfurimonas autotrophica]